MGQRGCAPSLIPRQRFSLQLWCPRHEGHLEQCGNIWSLRGIFRAACFDKLLKFGRETCPDLGGWKAGDEHGHLEWVNVGIGRVSQGHLVAGDSEGPDVSLGIVRRLGHHLGSHPVGAGS
jgi:hypothetical protein